MKKIIFLISAFAISNTFAVPSHYVHTAATDAQVSQAYINANCGKYKVNSKKYNKCLSKLKQHLQTHG